MTVEAIIHSTKKYGINNFSSHGFFCKNWLITERVRNELASIVVQSGKIVMHQNYFEQVMVPYGIVNKVE